MKEFKLFLLLLIFQLLLIKVQNSDNNTLNRTACYSNDNETFFFLKILMIAF